MVDERVGQMCGRRPLARSVLRRYGIDPAEDASLSDVCALRRVDVVEVMRQIEHAEARVAGDWASRPLPDLVAHVVTTYHRGFHPLIGSIEARVGRRSPQERELRARLEELRALVAEHMEKEERVLFPWLCSSGSTAAGPIRAMQREHEDTFAVLREIQAAARRRDPAVVAALETLERALCEHIYFEDEVLFRRALEA